ncbi:MAG: cobalamin-independent methionine synthase II family protein [Phycisphaeraceae bacterium]
MPTPLRTTVIGSYPFPGWLELASAQLERFGSGEVAEMQHDAVVAAVHDQLAAGLDEITDGEQTRFDFNLSFYGYLRGIDLESRPRRRFGPAGHDQRGRHAITGELAAPDGLGAVEEYERLVHVVDALRPEPRPRLKASIPGPYTMSGRLVPNDRYKDRWAVTEALLPLIRDEIARLVDAGCAHITVDEPSMSCYAHREDPARFVEIFNRTIAPAVGRTRLSTHLCFGNFKGRPVGKRTYAPLLPAFLELDVDEVHLEMANREFAELEVTARFAERFDVAVGVVDVKSYYIEPVEEVADRVRRCMAHVPAEKLLLAPDCGLSQTARWAARLKLANLVAGAKQVRQELR